jgi:soluble lytic murein transglycosylase
MISILRAIPFALALSASDLTTTTPTWGGDAVGSPSEAMAVTIHHARMAGRTDGFRLYLAAAERAPEVADWLLLRAAALSPDSTERAGLYARITAPVVRARILAVEAVARERAGDLAGAALRYDSLGQFGEGFRLRARLAWTPTQRAALWQGLIQVIRERPGQPEALQALSVLASHSVAVPPHDLLELAGLAVRSKAPEAAAALYARAAALGLAKASDMLAYGQSLASIRRLRAAARVFARLESNPVLRGEAMFGQAWSLARLGYVLRARPTVEQLLRSEPDDTLVRPRALFLAGDLAWQSGDRAAARTYWNELLQRFPRSDSAARGGFLTALTWYEDGKTVEAAEQWERIHLLNGRNEGLAAGYWAGRAWTDLGQARRAAGLWQSVIARDSTSYYAMLSARRLNVDAWRPGSAPDRFLRFTDVDSAMARIRALRALGMDEEVGLEVGWLVGGSEQSAERILSVADALRRTGEPGNAVQAARQALVVGAAQDARTYRLLYPRHYEEDLTAHAAEAGLDPLLVAALIRQESRWNPRALSRVGARGLMQVMPATGRLIARSLRVHGWHPDQLYEPATNLRFGTWFLAQAIRRYGGDLPQALAAYNAGGSRVGGWASGPAARDSELFVERIDLRETRDYVRIIQQNLTLYHALYADSTASPS